jgi:hypothetical protein
MYLLDIIFLHIKLLCCSPTSWQSLSNIYNYQIMASTTVSSSKRSGINYLNDVFYLPVHDQSGHVFSHQEKSKCIYQCCNVGTLYSWLSNILIWWVHYSHSIVITNII